MNTADYRKKYYEENKEKLKAYQRWYYRKNKDNKNKKVEVKEEPIIEEPKGQIVRYYGTFILHFD